MVSQLWAPPVLPLAAPPLPPAALALSLSLPLPLLLLPYCAPCAHMSLYPNLTLSVTWSLKNTASCPDTRLPHTVKSLPVKGDILCIVRSIRVEVRNLPWES